MIGKLSALFRAHIRLSVCDLFFAAIAPALKLLDLSTRLSISQEYGRNFGSESWKFWNRALRGYTLSKQGFYLFFDQNFLNSVISELNIPEKEV
jgi:hypothetical protein